MECVSWMIYSLSDLIQGVCDTRKIKFTCLFYILFFLNQTHFF